MALPTPGTSDTYTSNLNSSILANGVGTAWAFGGGTTTYNLDPNPGNGVNLFRYTFTNGGTITLTITNPTLDGHVITVILNNGAVALSVSWPTNIVWHRNTLPATPVNALVTVRLRWDATAAVWTEVGRSRVPVSGSSPLPAGWQTPTLTSPWAVNGAWQAPQYRIDHDGFVHLRGVMFNSSAVAANTTLFTLPAGFRPVTNDILGVIYTNDVFGTVGIASSGAVTNRQAVSSGGYIALSGASFSID